MQGVEREEGKEESGSVCELMHLWKIEKEKMRGPVPKRTVAAAVPIGGKERGRSLGAG